MTPFIFRRTTRSTGDEPDCCKPEDRPELFRAFPATIDAYRTSFPPYWSPYKTANEKLDYHRRLPLEIQPFVRSLLEKLRPEVDRLQSTLTINEYLANMRGAWDRHVAVNQAVDCFLTYELRNVFGDWSPAEWRLARRLLVAAMVTDREKALYSIGVKGVLDREASRLVEKYRHVSPEVAQMVVTPSFVTFYDGRDFAYKKYMLSVARGEPDENLKRRIIGRYHAGDERLFERRLEQLGAVRDADVLADELGAAERNYRERAIAKNYQMMERPDLRIFDELLRFDNVTEYEHTYSLKGLPDLFLREEILRRLVEAGHFRTGVSVFAISLDEFLVAIDAQIARVEHHFTIRLRPYRQNYDTCGTACIMSILNRRGSSLDEDTELRLWQLVGKPYNFPGGLAWVLLRNGFQVSYLQDRNELLRADNPEFASMSDALVWAAENYIALHEKAIAADLHFNITDWDFCTVASEITRGNVCLLYLHVTSTISHVVIARGLKRGRLEIIDPLGQLKYLDKDLCNMRINHPMGKRMLVIKKLPNDFFDVIERHLIPLGF